MLSVTPNALIHLTSQCTAFPVFILSGLPTFPIQTSMAASCHKELQVRQQFGEWIRNDIQYSSVQNYELTYAHFVRFPS